ncbi:CGNR zinc finger domain-containing protein [Halopolyspora algeriensis]|uniref:CGNR zinc finger domain-containing protein n=1 Tax=Halopolyspora algeriensis TaxID=1500506 RepID=UPI001FEB5B93|nr:CGNR zinc finger domain-containing protein [Halopolyspora algeriensis]
MRTEAVGANSAAAPDRTPPAARKSVELDTEQDLRLLLDFLNTCDVETGTELMDDPAGWQQWCAERGLSSAPDTEAAREIRDTMRASVVCGSGSPRNTPPADRTEATGTSASPAWPIRVVLHGGVPVLTGTDAVGSVLAAATRLVTTGHWDRIKICPAENCLWAFYDRSRNRSRTWCSMRVCGNREKARSWRERRTAG